MKKLVRELEVGEKIELLNGAIGNFFLTAVS